MSAIDYVIIVLATEISLIFYLKTYSKLSNEKLKIDNFFKILFITLILGGFVLNGYLNYNFSRLFISFTLWFICFYVVFKDNFSDCLIRSSICYIVLCLIETIMSFIVFISFENINEFNNTPLFKMIFSIINCIVAYFIISRKKFIAFVDYIIMKITTKRIMLGLLLILLLVAFLLSQKYVISSFDLGLYLINMSLSFCFIILFSIIVYNKYKASMIKKEQEVLLNFMTNYEKLIDENNVKLHEVHNDLLVLKSMNRKSDKDYEKYLNDLLIKYNKNSIAYKNMHKLPSGLKGILYYKVHEMEREKIKIEMHLSNKIFIPIENIDHKDYSLLLKSVSILLDNARESAVKSKDKTVFIDISDSDKEINIIIGNTFSGMPDISKLYNKNYSTKGNKRGYGLYILKELIDNSTILFINQFIEGDYFISKLTIEK